MKLKQIILSLLLLASPFFTKAQENDAFSCSDGIDNDGDGLIDCEDGDCLSFSNDGCAICSSGISFADIFIEYIPGCPVEDDFPSGILGVNDWTGGSAVDEPQVVILGQGGSIKIGFTNNLITNSGDFQEDIWIFEVGPVVEACNIELQPFDTYTLNQLQNLGIPDVDNDGYFEVGMISGATSGFDIDNLISGYPANTLLFDALEIIDVDDAPCGTSNTPGADIDAVCAIFSLEVDCDGLIGGTAILDDCEQCLEADDLNFNNCLDCEGTPFGTAIIDDCGECLDPEDDNFNACIDCEGVLNGTAIMDNCEQCLQANDSEFNNCLDCAETPFGTAVFDECGECLESEDVNFNACIDCEGVLNGTALIDDCGLCLQVDHPNFNNCLDCVGTPFGTAIIDECGECLESEDVNFNACVDCEGVLNGTALIDDCGLCLQVDHPDFNNCLDCAGTPFGTALFDECGECLESENEGFNSCVDCKGVPNGTAIIDDCGQCLQPSDSTLNNCLDCSGTPFGLNSIDICGLCLAPNDPSYNQTCNDIILVYVPNAFTPDQDGLNEFLLPSVIGISASNYSFTIFDRWGEKIFETTEPNAPWLGNYKGSNHFVANGIYLWQLNVKAKYSNTTKRFVGHVSVIR